MCRRSSSCAVTSRPESMRMAWSLALRSSTSVARNISGMAIVMRNSCSDSTLSSALPPAKGPRPCTAPEIDKNATMRRDVLTPTGPNRTAARRKSGSGRYTSAGMPPPAAVGPLKTRTLIASSPQPIRQASTQRARDAPVEGRASPGDPGQERRRQHEVSDGLGKKPHTPGEPVILRRAGGGRHERSRERSGDHRDSCRRRDREGC